MKKYIALGLMIVASISVKQMVFSKTSPVEVPELLASSRSKEFCSCYFLLKNSEEYCLKSVLKGYPLFNYKLEKNRVSFSNPLFSSTAAVSANSKFGCSFLK